MLKVGIVGLPNAGKSTLFNALIDKPKAMVAAHPFTTIDKNIGVVNVPDETLFQLAKIEKIDKVTPTTITFVDIAGLIKGASQGEGLGNQFLHHIREVDLILHLVRFFKDEKVAHVHAKIDPEEDLAVVNEELLLADLQSLEKKSKTEKISTEQQQLINKVRDWLNQGKQASQIFLTNEEREFIKTLNLLTTKKQFLIANIGEEEINQPAKEINRQPVLSVCAQLEAELNELAWVDQQKFLKDVGLEKTLKEKIIKESYQALDIITFYTIAKRAEARAWTLRRGGMAVEAAGKIHTDFVKNFIKAEAINAKNLIEVGSWHKAHEMGKIGLHGKEYLVQNQDVLEIKAGVK